jgi:hypothetical protein
MKLAWAVAVVSLSVGCSESGKHPIRDHEPDAGEVPDSGDPGAIYPEAKLVKSAPADGATGVPGTTWVRLDFAEGIPEKAGRAVHLDCGEDTPPIDVDALGNKTLVVNPKDRLPGGSTCTVRLPDGSEIGFTVAEAGAPAVVAYDRNDPAALDPFPDDYYLVADSTTRTGVRADIRVPAVADGLKSLFAAALEPTAKLDGMSPSARSS